MCGRCGHALARAGGGLPGLGFADSLIPARASPGAVSLTPSACLPPAVPCSPRALQSRVKALTEMQAPLGELRELVEEAEGLPAAMPELEGIKVGPGWWGVVELVGRWRPAGCLQDGLACLPATMHAAPSCPPLCSRSSTGARRGSCRWRQWCATAHPLRRCGLPGIWSVRHCALLVALVPCAALRCGVQWSRRRWPSLVDATQGLPCLPHPHCPAQMREVFNTGLRLPVDLPEVEVLREEVRK